MIEYLAITALLLVRGIFDSWQRDHPFGVTFRLGMLTWCVYLFVGLVRS